MESLVVLISSSSSDDEEESENDSVYSESDDKQNDDNNDSDSDYKISDNNHELQRYHNPRHQGNDELPELSLNECKEYLRKYGLRLSGTKEECLQRVKEHGRLKAGRGELLYPRSSFSINCTGDACKGDVVFFKQRVHKKQGYMVGKRSVAGRIVKESYGASKQQHTFTIEVLWSKPFRNLPPLSTLLVKGRNLYKFGTFRQPWRNEAERSKVLSEKHDRGDEARHVRKLRQTDIASINDRGTKRQKLHHGGPSTSKHQTHIDKQKSSRRRGTTPVKKNKTAQKKDVRFKKTESRWPIQPPDHVVHSGHHLQEPSSSFSYDTTPLSGFPPVGFSVYGPYNNGHPRPNHVIYQPPHYHHHHYEQPAPRYRFG
uniref:zinc finger CCCH domain-containing protein 62-like n=1 Tax=Erigeron canadensis TaxID=72917 RepID=UPI001CB94890|nr:zinc finger CCCH domain-containing protein 62-like [Erigeron canadensis]